jgi:hypothetical protein
MIEKGRHLHLNVEDRLCKKCNLNLVEDEFHSIIICPVYSDERKQLFDIFDKSMTDWKEMNEESRFTLIMKMNTQTNDVAKFIHSIITYEHNNENSVTGSLP